LAARLSWRAAARRHLRRFADKALALLAGVIHSTISDRHSRKIARMKT
jgi:hypothetical protein